MKKKLVLAVAVSLISVGIALALDGPRLTFIKTLEQIKFSQLIGELESATGLQYEADCTTCSTNGYVMFSGDLLEIITFTENGDRMDAVTYDQDLENIIIGVVSAHVPE